MENNLTRGERLKQIIEDYFEKLRSEYPEITNNLLDTEGAIHYMNGNDSTEFDFDMNFRLCEFYIFHKSTELGFIKLMIFNDGRFVSYTYLDEGNAQGIKKEEYIMSEDDVEFLCDLLVRKADGLNIWDKPIREIDFKQN